MQISVEILLNLSYKFCLVIRKGNSDYCHKLWLYIVKVKIQNILTEYFVVPLECIYVLTSLLSHFFILRVITYFINRKSIYRSTQM
jgi:hypothetical protein